jgi:hypothetical protein
MSWNSRLIIQMHYKEEYIYAYFKEYQHSKNKNRASKIVTSKVLTEKCVNGQVVNEAQEPRVSCSLNCNFVVTRMHF